MVWRLYKSGHGIRANFGEIVEDSTSFGSLVNIVQSNKFLSIPITIVYCAVKSNLFMIAWENPPDFQLPTSKKISYILTAIFLKKAIL